MKAGHEVNVVFCYAIDVSLRMAAGLVCFCFLGYFTISLVLTVHDKQFT